MSDYFEVDFLDVESDKSGDAIALRYELSGATYIHVVDGGFQDTGPSLAKHIRNYYGNPKELDHVVATHPDGDHAGGLRTVLEEFNIGTLWMLRPWLYAEELLPRFKNYTSVENLRKRLREIYPNLAALEEIALKKKMRILEPFQGTMIGAFRVMSPARAQYLDLIVESEKTPESTAKKSELAGGYLAQLFEATSKKVANFIKAAWGVEVFSDQETSAENEMSVVQYANLCNKKILLTADAGRRALAATISYAPGAGLTLPSIDRFQVPHHGSRRNVSTEILDKLLGPRLPSKPTADQTSFQALISSAKKDEDHPRKAVVRALIHRGAKVFSTEGAALHTYMNAPDRGWKPATAHEYPEDQEE